MAIKEGDCLMFSGYKNSGGYGVFKFMGKATPAHRAAWVLFVGKIPESMCVLHRCDNRACININHLFLGTNKDNVDDKMYKNRHRSNPPVGDKCHFSKLSYSDVIAIRTQSSFGELTTSDLSKKYNVSKATIRRTINKQTWKHI